MKTTKLIISIGIMAAAAALAVTGFFVLPETLVVQVNAAGQASNTMPKLLGILLPFLMCVVSSIVYLKSGKSAKSLIVALAGIVAFALLFVFNL
jgi:uncharacterized membrane protein